MTEFVPRAKLGLRLARESRHECTNRPTTLVKRDAPGTVIVTRSSKREKESERQGGRDKADKADVGLP